MFTKLDSETSGVTAENSEYPISIYDFHRWPFQWQLLTHLTFMGPCIVISSNITNKMRRYTIFFITVNSLHVSGGFSAHHQEIKNCTHSIRYMSSLLAATASGVQFLISWWWAEKPPETYRALTLINNTV